MIGNALAETRTVFKTSKPIEIFTKANLETIMVFESEIINVFIDHDQFFNIKINDKKDKLIIRQVINRFITVSPPCMIITLKNNDEYAFFLKNKETKYDDLVQIKNTPDTNKASK